MITHLQSTEIEDLLQTQFVARIGCTDGNRVYVVPISYAYDGKYIYCHSFEGRKISVMRKNPNVCFQTDKMRDMGNWKSVIAWGTYEEINNKLEIKKALQLLISRRLPVISSVTTHLGETWPFSLDSSTELNEIPGIVFRIELKEKTGRSEITSETSCLAF